MGFSLRLLQRRSFINELTREFHANFGGVISPPSSTPALAAADAVCLCGCQSNHTHKPVMILGSSMSGTTVKAGQVVCQGDQMESMKNVQIASKNANELNKMDQNAHFWSPCRK